MYQGVYSITLWKGKRTSFHKKYFVFDGLGGLFFDTLAEARKYVRIKASLLKKVYTDTKHYYRVLSDIYLDRLVSFRSKESTSNIVNFKLSEILDCYKYLGRSIFPQYSLPKIKFIYTELINISKLLNLKLMTKSLSELFNDFFTPYPEYRPAKKEKVNHIKITQNVQEKCII